MSTKLCIHCKHCSASFGMNTNGAKCQRKPLEVDPVDGSTQYAECRQERYDFGEVTVDERCGPEAKFWEERVITMHC